jgi:hypothetical protein
MRCPAFRNERAFASCATIKSRQGLSHSCNIKQPNGRRNKNQFDFLQPASHIIAQLAMSKRSRCKRSIMTDSEC